jgi:two-component system sensor histidine kinase/response regulator
VTSTETTDNAAIQNSGVGTADSRAMCPHILVAEDNVINLRVIGAMLKSYPRATHFVTDGAQAVQAIQDGHVPDLILMDIQMPVMNGYQAMAAIRVWEDQRKHPRIPIIALTAETGHEERGRCLGAGADDFLSKPILKGALLEALGRWLPAPSAVATNTPKPVPTPALHLQGFDVAAVMARLNGDTAHFRKLMDMFRTRGQTEMKAVRSALVNQDLALARQHIHALKGSAGLLGANELHASLASLEVICQHPLPDDGTHMEALEQVWAATLDVVTVFLNSPSTHG